MLDFLLEQAAKGRFFVGVGIVSFFVVGAFFAHQKHGTTGILKLFLVSWCAVLLLYLSVLGVGYTYGLTSYVQRRSRYSWLWVSHYFFPLPLLFLVEGL